ncbi:unnamed protein product [Urochloa humidicola]
MPSAMVDTAAATPPLDLTTRRRRRPAALSNSTAGCVAAALSDANGNAGVRAGAVAAAPKPKSKTVASRYLTPSTAKSPPATAAERPRQAPPSSLAADAVATTGNAATTRRTLAVAFQSPTYSLETTRARSGSPSASAAAAAATPTPEKKMSGSAPGTAARAKVSDASQNTYRWPAASSAATAPPRGGHGGRTALAAAMTPERSASSRKQSAAAAAARPAAFHATPRRASVDGAGNEYLLALSSDDTDASSSSGGSGDGAAVPHRRSVGSGPPRPSPRSVAAMMSSSAQFARDATGTRSERFAIPAPASPLPAPVKKRSLFNGLLSSPFGRSSLKQPSPNKPAARSSFRRTASPSPARRSTGDAPGYAGNTQGRTSSSSGCGFDGDTKLKAPAAIKTEEEHQLRLLYTRNLQWRLVNAQAGTALSLQTTAAEKTLSGAWIAILRTRKSVAIRKMQIQLLRNNCKLMAVLRGQMKYLEEWSFLERDYAHSLSGTTQALNATVLRLPVSNGAMADIQGIKNALCAAVDVMHPIGNSTSTQLPKLARTKVLVSQLSRVFIQEHILIAQCRDLLSTLASMHVKYSSLQAQRIQINQRRRQHFQ